MSLGCPIVTTDAGGIPEMIRNGKNGLIVTRGDLSAFVRSCERLLENPDLAASLGAQARIDCNKFYDIDVIAKKTIDVFERLVQRVKSSDRPH